MTEFSISNKHILKHDIAVICGNPLDSAMDHMAVIETALIFFFSFSLKLLLSCLLTLLSIFVGARTGYHGVKR